MSKFARVVSGTVQEILTVPDGQQLANCFTSVIVAQCVPVPNGTAVDQYWTWNGSSFAAPVPPTPTPTDVLGAKIAAGIQITSTGTPALNGTYALDQTTLNNLGNLLAAIGAGIGLPGGGSTVALADTSGAPHSFTASQVKDLEGAIATYVFNLRVSWNLLSAGQAPNWPSLPVTIP